MQEAKPKRYWFRRFLAFLVDWLLAAAASVLILALFVQSPSVRHSTGAWLSDCSYYEADQQPLEWRAVYEQYIGDAQHIDVAFCSDGLLPNGRWIVMRGYNVVSDFGDIDGKGALVLPLSDEGDFIRVWYPGPLFTVLIFMLGSALSLRFWRSTPGKWLFGLHVNGEGCALCRSVRRLWPLLPRALIMPVILYLRPGDPASFLFRFGELVTLGIIGFFLWYYLWPFINWTGQHRWDKATGFSVVAKRDNITQEAPA